MVDKADILIRALKEIKEHKMIDLSDDLELRSMQLAGLWAYLKVVADQALREYAKELKPKE